LEGKRNRSYRRTLAVAGGIDARRGDWKRCPECVVVEAECGHRLQGRSRL